MNNFEYFEPKTIKDTTSLLIKYRGRANLIAGGTDLVVRMKQNMINPQYLINLKNIPNLSYIRYDDNGGLRIGALTTLQEIESSAVIREKYGMLSYAAHKMATVQVRNLGTIGGNLCNASPAADTAPPLIGFEANASIVGSSGERSVAVEDFFLGPGETTLREDEILSEIRVPIPSPQTGAIYLRLAARSAKDIPAVGVAVVINLDNKKKVCRDVRIVLGAVAPTPIRAKSAEKVIKGNEIDDVLAAETARLASEEANPISDLRSSAEYRREIVKVLTKRGIKKAWELAGTN